MNKKKERKKKKKRKKKDLYPDQNSVADFCWTTYNVDQKSDEWNDMNPATSLP